MELESVTIRLWGPHPIRGVHLNLLRFVAGIGICYDSCVWANGGFKLCRAMELEFVQFALGAYFP